MRKKLFFILLILSITSLPVRSSSCSKAGGLINHAAGTNRCCEGLAAMSGGGCPENNCKCMAPSFGGLVRCSNCGNKICERKNFENHCNCPEDCDILKKEQVKNPNCGNGFCESKYNENSQNCVTDCPVPIRGTRNLYKRKDLSNYYEQFRLKCEQNRCCLSSFNKAKKIRSEIFLKVMSGDCPTGYRLNTNKCPNSYAWCSKR